MENRDPSPPPDHANAPTPDSRPEFVVAIPPAAEYSHDRLTDPFDIPGGSLLRRSIIGGAATVSGQALRFILQLAGTAILARLLTPSDFGLIAMVATFTQFVIQFADMGLSAATVQRRQLTDAQVSTLFWINAALGVLVALATVAAAPLVAWFYDESSLTPIAMVLATAFVFGGLTVQHQAVLRRQMRFERLALAQIGATLFSIGVAVAFASAGAGYWSLVAMTIGSNFGLMAGTWVLCGWRPGPPRRGAGARGLLSFGGHVTLANALNFITRNLDNVLIGRFVGKVSLGFYDKAYQLLLFPLAQLNAPLTAVAVPALSRLQDEPQRYRRYYRQALLLTTALGMPIVAFAFLAADEIILLAFGSQWRDSVPLFRALAPAAFLGTFNVSTGWVYLSLGHARRQLAWTMVGAAVSAVGFAAGLRLGGTFGVAVSVSVVHVLLRWPALVWCFRGTFVSVRDVVSGIWRPAVTSVFPVLAMWPVCHWKFESGQWDMLHVAGRLAIMAVGYAIAAALSWILIPGGLAVLRETIVLLRSLRGRAASAPKIDDAAIR